MEGGRCHRSAAVHAACHQQAHFDPLLSWSLFSCYQQIRNVNSGNLTPEELKERQARSMQDPEIQTILTDPVMRQVRWGR